MRKSKLQHLIEAEVQAAKEAADTAEARKREFEIQKALTFLEVLDSVFSLREPDAQVDEEGNYIVWKISPAILMFLPAGKHNFVLEPVKRAFMSNSLNFSIVLDEGGKSYVRMNTPWYKSSGSDGSYFSKETSKLRNMDNVWEHIGLYKNNTSGIPPEHELFKDIDAALRRYVKEASLQVESSMLKHIAEIETKIIELEKELLEIQ